MAPRISWIGLGNMGRGMVKNLAEKGSYSKPLLIYNRTAARAEKLAGTLPSDSVKTATSIGEAVKESDLIFICI